MVPFIVSRIRSDHNEDNTSQILQEWGQNVKGLYHRVLVNVTSTPTKYEDASSPGEWSDSRYRQMIYLRQRALDVARKQWADYLFVSLPRTLYFSSGCFNTSLWLTAKHSVSHLQKKSVLCFLNHFLKGQFQIKMVVEEYCAVTP